MKSAFTLIKGDKHNSNTDYRDALPVNMIAINRPMFGAAGYMIQAPGLTQYATALDIHRGGLWNERQQTLFRVAGTELITVADDGTVAVLGTIPGTDLAVWCGYVGTALMAISAIYPMFRRFRAITPPATGPRSWTACNRIV